MTDNTPDAPAVALKMIHIVFDGPPGPEAGRFVEAEDADGKSINVGTWYERSNGYWELRIAAWNTSPTAALPSENDVMRVATLPADVHEFVSRTGLLATNHGGWFDKHGFAAINPLCDAANAILEKYDAAMAPEQIADGWRGIASAPMDDVMGWLLIETFAPEPDDRALLWGMQWNGGERENYSPTATNWDDPAVHWLLYSYEDVMCPGNRRFVTKTYCNGDESVGCWATHWRPLPSPPTEQEPQ